MLKNWLRAYAGRGERRASLQLTVEEHEIDAFNPFPDPIRLEIGDVFDLHAIRPREVRRVLEEYLNEAHEAGFSVVRIVHGKGKGVQREIVRAVLVRTPFVSDWMDAPPEAGGWGATIARFSPKEHVSKNSARAS